MAIRLSLLLLASLVASFTAPSSVKEGEVASNPMHVTDPRNASDPVNDAPWPEFEVIRWGQVGTAIAGSTGNTADFRIFNNGETKVTVSLSCSFTGPVSACSAPSSKTIYPESYRTVTVTFDIGSSGGTGLLTLTASDGGESSSDSHTINALGVGPLSFDGTMNPSLLVERSACATTGAGQSGLFQCGDLVLTHSMPAFRSQNRDRTLTLIYNSGTAKPVPIIMGDVWLDGIAQPDSFRTNVVIGTQNFPGWWDGAGLSSSRSRFAVAISAASAGIGTGLHPYTIETRNYYGSGPAHFDSTRSHLSDLIVVDRNDSPYGSGWWVAGIGELYPQAGATRVLAVEADGSAAAYDSIAPFVWRAPAGAFQDTIEWKQLTNPNPDSTGSAWFYERRLQDGTRIYYNQTGQQRYVVDRVGNVAGYFYASTTIGAGLSTIRIAPWEDSLVYTFGYDGAGRFDYVDDPAGRRLDVTVSTNDLLANITPVGNSSSEKIVFGYQADGRIEDRFSPNGSRTSYDYFGGTSQLETTTLPTTAAGTAVTTYRPIRSRGLNLGSQLYATAPLSKINVVIDGPRSVSDSVIIEVNNLGAPTKITDPVNRVTQITYDVTHPLLASQVTQPNGAVIEQVWDAAARLESTRNLSVSGGADSVHYDYDDPDAPEKPSRVTSPRGDSAGVDVATFAYASDGTLTSATNARNHTTSFTYNSSGQVETATEQSVDVQGAGTQNLTTTLYYDSIGNLDSIASPLGLVTQYDTDAYGNVVQVLSPEGRKQTFEYDVRNRRTQVGLWDAGQKDSTVMAYDEEDNLLSVRDPRGLMRQWEFDVLGRDTLMRDSRNEVEKKRYDLSSNLVWRQDRQGDTIVTSFDAVGRPQQIVRGAIKVDDNAELLTYRESVGTTLVLEDTITWTYSSGADTVVIAENSVSRVTRRFDLRGLLTQEIQELGAWAGAGSTYTQDYTYDIAGNRKSWTTPYKGSTPGHTYTYTYGAGNTLQTISGPVGTASYTFDQLGRRKLLSFSTGSVTSFGYDGDGRQVRILSTHPSQSPHPIDQVLTYDDDANLINLTEAGRQASVTSAPDTTEWVYDGKGQSVSERTAPPSGTPVVNRSHYDVAGNRTATGGADSVIYVVNSQANWVDRVEAPSGLVLDSMFYDANGSRVVHKDRVTQGFQSFTTFYNATGELVAIGPTNIRYGYDPYGRRVRIGSGTGSGNNRTIHDGSNVAFYGDGQIGAYFVSGPGTDEPVFMAAPSTYGCGGGSNYIFATTTGRLLDFQGINGADCIHTGSGAVWPAFGQQSGAVANSRSFALSRSKDGGAGSQSVSFFRNRYFDAATGRFTQEDPISFAGGLNLYNYSANNPATLTDPFGLCPPPPGCQDGDGEGSSASRLLAAGTVAAAADGPLPIGDIVLGVGVAAVAVEAVKTYREKVFLTYTRTHPLTGQVYSGRTSGVGDPKQLAAARARKHPARLAGFGAPVVDKVASGPGALGAIIGREQQLIDLHGGSLSDGGTSGNLIRSYARINPLGRMFHRNAVATFGGEIHPYTGVF